MFAVLCCKLNNTFLLPSEIVPEDQVMAHLLNPQQPTSNEPPFFPLLFNNQNESGPALTWESVDSYGRNVLHYASMYGLLRVCEAALSKGVDINKQDNFGCTPLHLAVFNSHRRIVKMLLDCGASVTIADGNGDNAIDLATGLEESPEMLEMLKTQLQREQIMKSLGLQFPMPNPSGVTTPAVPQMPVIAQQPMMATYDPFAPQNFQRMYPPFIANLQLHTDSQSQLNQLQSPPVRPLQQ